MTAVILILVLLVIGFFIWLGYYLWETSIEKYDYNIFGTWVIVRMLVGAISSFFAIALLGNGDIDGSGFVLAIVALIMLIWTFVLTLKRTNFFIAFFSLFYQIFLVGLLVFVITLFFGGGTNGGRTRQRAEVKLPRNMR